MTYLELSGYCVSEQTAGARLRGSVEIEVGVKGAFAQVDVSRRAGKVGAPMSLGLKSVSLCGPLVMVPAFFYTE